MKKGTTALLGATILLAAAPAASADVIAEIDAADEVERKLERRDRSYSYFASCRQLSKRRFTCSWSGTKRRAIADGRARVYRESSRRYRATITSFRVTRY